MALRELKELGRGGFGRVYLANDDKRNKLVAVKELLDPTVDLDRFVREARLLVEQINNPHVVRILEHYLQTDRPYFIMEYCDGGSLRGMIGKVSWRQTAGLLLQASRGLLGIHQVGGFHRDVKPDNLLLVRTPEGYLLKVVDFGLARRPQTAKHPMTQTPCGTRGYMAPELFLPVAQFTAMADVYSLGIVGVELLTAQLTSDAISSINAPTSFKNLLLRMTSLFPTFRPSMVEIANELAAIVNAGVEPTQPPMPKPSDKGSGGGLLLWGGVFALLAAAATNRRKWDPAVGRYRDSGGRFS